MHNRGVDNGARYTSPPVTLSAGSLSHNRIPVDTDLHLGTRAKGIFPTVFAESLPGTILYLRDLELDNTLVYML